MVQQLCPKWGGSAEAVLEFARGCVKEAPLGSLNGAVLADAHIELARDEGGFEAVYLRRPEVTFDLISALDRSVDHPYFRPVHGWVVARNSFAYALSGASQFVRAGRQFAEIGRRIAAVPWDYAVGPRLNFKRRQIWTFLRGGARG
jgi:hypothetical protein